MSYNFRYLWKGLFCGILRGNEYHTDVSLCFQDLSVILKINLCDTKKSHRIRSNGYKWILIVALGGLGAAIKKLQKTMKTCLNNGFTIFHYLDTEPL